MQGVGKGNTGILVLGATNTPWDLDPAMRRRFEKRIYIPLPDEVARKRMFEIHIGSTPHELEDEDFEVLAEMSEGFSGSDCSVIVRDALMEPIRAMSHAKYFKKIKNPDPNGKTDFIYIPCEKKTKGAIEMSLMDIDGDQLGSPRVQMDDFEQVLKSAKPSVSEADISRHEQWTKEFGQEG